MGSQRIRHDWVTFTSLLFSQPRNHNSNLKDRVVCGHSHSISPNNDLNQELQPQRAVRGQCPQHHALQSAFLSAEQGRGATLSTLSPPKDVTAPFSYFIFTVSTYYIWNMYCFAFPIRAYTVLGQEFYFSYSPPDSYLLAYLIILHIVSSQSKFVEWMDSNVLRQPHR